MKIINSFLAILALSIVFVSCESDFVPPHESVPKGGFVRFDVEVESISFVMDLTKETNPVFTAPIMAPSDNVIAYDLSFNLVSTQGVAGPFTIASITSLPTNLTFDAETVAKAAGVNLEDLKGRLDFNAEVTREDGTVFTFGDFTGDLNNPGQRQAMQFSVSLVCPSDLAGTFDYVQTNMVANGATCGQSSISGTVTWTETAPGLYATDDASFGQFGDCYGDTPAAGLSINDSCDLISVAGSDQYGDGYTYKVISVEGSSLTLEWTNTFKDGGTVVLTRQDGKDWPQLGS